MVKRAALLLACSMVTPLWLGAQTTTAIEGIVYDPAGAAVPGAAVKLQETATAAKRVVHTLDHGWYHAPQLAPGVYDVTVTAAGFRTELRRALRLSAGREERVDFHLSLGEERQTIEVTTEVPLVSPAAGDWGASIERQNLEQMPLNGRDIFDLAAQESGANVTTTANLAITSGGGLHVAFDGARPNQNSFRLDGIYINDWSDSAPASAAGRLLGLEGIQEVRLLSSPFSAEFGRAAGSIVTAVSKSGSNQLHGGLYEYFRHSALDAKNFFESPNRPISPLRQNQFGGDIGLPLRRDRLLLFANYEGLRQYSATAVNTTTLSDKGRQGELGSTTVTVAPKVLPYLALYPKANGADYGDGTAQYLTDTPSRTREDYLSTRLDYNISDAWRAGARFTFDDARVSTLDPFHIWNFVVPSRYQFLHTEAHFVQSPATVHSIYAGFSRIRKANVNDVSPGIPAWLSFVPGRQLGSITVTGLTDLGGYQARLPRKFADNDYQVNYDAVLVRGAHTFKLGAGYDRIQFNQVADLSVVGGYVFYSVTSLLLGQPATGDIMVPGSDTDRGWRQNLVHFFAQDDFHVTRRIELSLGVRYEPYSVPTEVNGKIATLADYGHASKVTLGGPLFVNPSRANFAPRVSLAWDPRGSGKTVVRAGTGIFYDQLGTPELVNTGNRMPPFYVRLLPVKPAFPDLLASVTQSNPPMSIDVTDYYQHQPYVIQYQAAVEHELGAATLVKLGYVGSRGVHLAGQLGNVNPTAPSIDAGGNLYFPAGGPPVNPAWGQIGMRRTLFDSAYQGLQAGVERRWRSVRVELHYTWSKAIDDASNAIYNDFGNSNLVPTMFDYSMNRGRADFDLGQVFTANGSYRLPAPGRGMAAKALGGWQFFALAQAQTGFPFSPTVGFDDANLLGGSTDLGQRPNFAGAGRVILGNPAQYFNPLAFALPASGHYGNLGRNVLTGPGLANFNLALHRTLWRTERQSLNIRLEAFNAANRPNFQVPNGLSLFNSSRSRVANAGQISTTSTLSRQIQLAMKWVF